MMLDLGDVAFAAKDGKGPVLSTPPEKRKLHFLDRTDPNFKKDLATSVKHVEHVVAQLNRQVPPLLTSDLTSVTFTQLETVCRETVRKRRAHSDNGDVQITWTRNGRQFTAILEIKQRKSPKFTCKDDFPYDTMITDEKRLFDKIRIRGDTIGYLVTNHDKSVFLFVAHDRVEATYTTHTSMDRWKGRIRTYVDVPIGEFVQGIPECAAAICRTLIQFEQRDPQAHAQLLIKMSTEKLESLKQRLRDAHKTTEKLRREIDAEEVALTALTTT